MEYTEDSRPSAPRPRRHSRLAARAAFLAFFVLCAIAPAAAFASATDPYGIRVASFQKEENAGRQVRMLTAKGWPAFSRKIDLAGTGTWWRVYVGPYESLDAARRQAARLREAKLAGTVAIERTPPLPERTVRPAAPPPPAGHIQFTDSDAGKPSGAAAAAESPPCPDDACGPEPSAGAAPLWVQPETSSSAAAPVFPGRPKPAPRMDTAAPAGPAPETPPEEVVEEREPETASERPVAADRQLDGPGAAAPAPETVPAGRGTAEGPARAATATGTGRAAAPTAEPPAAEPSPPEPRPIAPVFPGDPVEARKYYEKANEYVAKGMLEIALVNYSRAIELDPSFAEAHNGRGVAYEAFQRVELAIADYDAAVRLKPAYGEALLNRGLACRKTGRFDQANRDLESACGLNNRRACEELAAMRGAGK